MKISAHDPIAKYLLCFLNGKDVTQLCTYADEEDGLVYLLVKNKANRCVQDDDRQGILVSQRRGEVEIILRDDAPEAIIRKYYEMKAAQR